MSLRQTVKTDPDCGHDVTEVCQLSDKSPVTSSLTGLTAGGVDKLVFLENTNETTIFSRNYFVGMLPGALAGALRHGCSHHVLI